MSSASISEKMEDKRLTGERYSLHFEVCTRDPIGVGKRNGRTTVKPDIQKPSVGAEGFCLSEANKLHGCPLFGFKPKSLILIQTLLDLPAAQVLHLSKSLI
jgi:hypothetical protein